MMFKKSTFNMTYIGEIFTKILVLPYIGKELNMIIMLPDENVDLEMVRVLSPDLCWEARGSHLLLCAAVLSIAQGMFLMNAT